MGKRGAGSAGSGQGSGKIAKTQTGQPSTKQTPLLAANPYASLATPEVPKKEKMPPFYVRKVEGDLMDDLNRLIKKGLKASLKLCSEGYKIIVPSQQHYNAVAEYLRQKKAEYFSHDIEANKPFKVVLRGLFDMDVGQLKVLLTIPGLKVEAIHKIRRRQTNTRFRDQLYLIHLVNGTTNLKELKAIRAVANVIVEWEKYRPIHRDVTQCTKCFLFGHGTRNCHMSPRCEKCGANHDAAQCVTEVLISRCVNCDGDHPSTDRTCPKRVEFIEMRRRAAAKRSQQSKQNQAILNPTNFPALQPPRPHHQVPNLQPLPLNHNQRPASGPFPGPSTIQQNPTPCLCQCQCSAPATVQLPPAPITNLQNPGMNQTLAPGSQYPPGFRTLTQVVSDKASGVGAAAAPGEELYSFEEAMAIYSELLDELKTCTTKKDQIAAITKFGLKAIYG